NWARVVATLSWREWVRFVRQRNRVFGAVGQPIIFWVLFAAGLGPSFRLPGAAEANVSYGEYFFPGTVILILLFTAIFTTISVIEDRREGFLQGVLVAPIPRSAMVFGKLAGGTLIALAQAYLFTLLGLAIGFHVSVASVLLIALLLGVVGFALTGLGFVLAWRMDSTQGFHAVMSVLLMPMWLLSGAFFPPGEGVMAWMIRLNPLTYGVAGLRRLLYLGADATALPQHLPGMTTCWVVSLAFAVAMTVAAWWVAGRRTTPGG
ncbi:MAG: ABC transporter permease, partial [Planctomycetales bacterium]|nr:ABC transporter permease [Planctomycetales bacterium]